jgi:hypothetical protein
MSVPQALQQISRNCSALMRDVQKLKLDVAASSAQPRTLDDVSVTRAEMLNIANTATKVNATTAKAEYLSSAKADAMATARTLIKSECPGIAKSVAESVVADHAIELASLRRELDKQVVHLTAELDKQAKFIAELQATLSEASAAGLQASSLHNTAPRKAPVKRKPKVDKDALVADV